ncbi:NAD-dependent epimerase/dehydratase family protein [Hydrogenophaga sp. YM1]|uniref:NAD-dependent epimerase/dehydratase family protein n=1 Tax=Hydrogenophaga sp. YM1 TaxID=2806262 RepID=UPI00195825BD|nr:NAD-dependent epimerase/dehydratase family protein [Hydrogenophaga sp. YM1]QRR32461.1 NAD-dependent epimerase/dehydratase family protein [Hydrogenophaga sp. YM1]
MNIFITGAGGYIGGSVAHALLAAGHRIRGLTRAKQSAERMEALGITPVIGTLDDAELLASEARASDGVINTASADHAGAVQALIGGLIGSGKPFLHTSGSSVIGDDVRGSRRSEQVFDEDTPFVVSPLKRARRELDLHVLAAAQRGVRSAVICPSNIYGVGHGLNPNSVQIPFLVENALAHGAVQLVGTGQNVWSNVHIDDVVTLYLLALEKAPAGAFYFAENGEASFQDLGEAIRLRLGLSRIDAIDPEEAAARWGEAKAYYTLGSNSRVRAKRAREELGWRPRHGSVIRWIQSEMPIDLNATASAASSASNFQS